jgi:hypothetical protein
VANFIKLLIILKYIFKPYLKRWFLPHKKSAKINTLYHHFIDQIIYKRAWKIFSGNQDRADTSLDQYGNRECFEKNFLMNQDLIDIYSDILKTKHIKNVIDC